MAERNGHRPEVCQRLDCRSETCIQRWVARLPLPNGPCPVCARQFMDALTVAFPALEWPAEWFARAGLPTEGVTV